MFRVKSSSLPLIGTGPLLTILALSSRGVVAHRFACDIPETITIGGPLDETRPEIVKARLDLYVDENSISLANNLYGSSIADRPEQKAVPVTVVFRGYSKTKIHDDHGVGGPQHGTKSDEVDEIYDGKLFGTVVDYRDTLIRMNSTGTVEAPVHENCRLKLLPTLKYGAVVEKSLIDAKVRMVASEANSCHDDRGLTSRTGIDTRIKKLPLIFSIQPIDKIRDWIGDLIGKVFTGVFFERRSILWQLPDLEAPSALDYRNGHIKIDRLAVSEGHFRITTSAKSMLSGGRVLERVGKKYTFDSKFIIHKIHFEYDVVKMGYRGKSASGRLEAEITNVELIVRFTADWDSQPAELTVYNFNLTSYPLNIETPGLSSIIQPIYFNTLASEISTQLNPPAWNKLYDEVIEPRLLNIFSRCSEFLRFFLA